MTDTEKPDFGDWIKSQSGIECMRWPVSDVKYLENRLFWAFDAGRDRIWNQYLKQKQQTEHAHSEGFNQGWNEALDSIKEEMIRRSSIGVIAIDHQRFLELIQKLRK